MARRVVDEPLEPGDEFGESPDPESGAVVVVTAPAPDGGAPASDDDGSAAEGDLEGVESDAVDRFDIRLCRIRIRPRAGDGEPGMLAVVRAPHRRDAFEAARWALDQVRTRLG